MMTDTRTDTDGMLRSALRGNALFSLASGAALALAAGPLADLTDLPAGALRVVGIGLLPYAWLLAIWSRRRPIRPAEARAAIAADVAWVAGTGVLLAGWPDVANTTGRVLLVDVALAVAAFAVWQYLGLRRSTR